MANWSDLKAAVASIVKTNGNKEITGQLLQNVLNNIISNVGLNSSFAGIATPETNPGTPDGNVFYLATTAGTYSNFNGIVINSGEAVILEWKGSWVKKDSGFTTKEKLSELEENTNQKLSELGRYMSNPEYVRAYTDAEGRFLWGIKQDGSIEWAKGVPTPVKKYIESLYLENDEEVERINQLVIGLLDDVKELTDTYHYVSNPEWACAIVDSDGHILMGIRTDGSYYVHNREMFETYDDVEGRHEMTLDAEGKIIAFRDKEGVRHEKKMSISDGFSLGVGAMSELQKSLRESGFNIDHPTDWSNESAISLPIPRYCAKVNIKSDTGLAITKVQDKKCIIEYWDKSGNYFRKYIVLNAQGSSSMAYIEKNQSIDVYNDESCEESCDITFGNWVAQDSFHLKCYYIDVFRGIANVGYNYCEEVIRYLNCRNNRVIFDNSSITKLNSTGKFSVDFGDGALCHPDGFPFELYVNGEYYGLFAWNLKKHRKNYSMDKKDYTSTILDGILDKVTFFHGVIDWTQFELRNPKDLITMDGQKYDADENCNELIDETSSVYDGSNDLHVKTAQLKKLIVRQSEAMQSIVYVSDIELARETFKTYYDVDAMICYYIISNVLYNFDGFRKNWIWTIYGNIASPSFYDLDSIFGRDWTGTYVLESSTTSILGNYESANNLPTGQLERLFRNEIESTYKILRDAQIIDVDNIMKHLNKWMVSVGIDAYERNLKKWPGIPSYRLKKTVSDGTVEGGMYDSAKRIELWLEERIANLDNYFKYNV